MPEPHKDCEVSRKGLLLDVQLNRECTPILLMSPLLVLAYHCLMQWTKRDGKKVILSWNIIRAGRSSPLRRGDGGGDLPAAAGRRTRRHYQQRHRRDGGRRRRRLLGRQSRSTVVVLLYPLSCVPSEPCHVVPCAVPVFAFS